MNKKHKMIGILGGGQLGRMLGMSAAKLGFSVKVYDPNPESPAFEIASSQVLASFDDHQALTNFAKSADVVTFEFENIPSLSLDLIAKYTPIFPSSKALKVSQDRVTEKNFIESLGLKTCKYWSVPSTEKYNAILRHIEFPALLKSCRNGYDGKGQLLISQSTPQEEINRLFKQGPCIIEEFVKFSKEISVIVARNEIGEVVCYDPGENTHRAGMLETTVVPANIPKNVLVDCILAAGKIVNDLNYVGVMGVEFFFVAPSTLLVNEIAPRVHNSGHWTQNGCIIDQFEQHIRAITGLPLGDGTRHSNVKMVNLIGADILKATEKTNAAVYVYGKKLVKHGRKMGHINYVTPK